MNYNVFLKENCFLFKGISNEELDLMLLNDGISIVEYEKDSVLHNCDKSGKIGIIMSGEAIIKSCENGVIIKRLYEKDLFGAASLFNKPVYSTYVISTSKCQVLILNKSFIKKCIESNANIALNYIEFLSTKINFLNNKISSYTAKSAENKLYNYLCQLPRVDNKIELPVDLSNLSKMLGVSRITLYRSLDKLENQGLISRINNKLIIIKEV
ncbi:MAG: Crp/Fnr family transcriptional regulator [Clostridia bacterium]|nr:Crp/Fnr family transcriptional regulator [Clostridia bacterium]